MCARVGAWVRAYIRALVRVMHTVACVHGVTCQFAQSCSVHTRYDTYIVVSVTNEAVVDMQ